MPDSQRDKAKANRRAAIIGAAALLIEEEGLAAATVRRIADIADVSPATVYNLIGSRDDVFDALFDSLIGEVDAGPEPTNPLTGIPDLGVIAARFLISRAQWFRPLMAERNVAVAFRDGPRLQWGRAVCSDLLRRAIDAGELDPAAGPTELARLLVDTFNSDYALWAIGTLDDNGFVERVRRDANTLLSSAATASGRAALGTLESRAL